MIPQVFAHGEETAGSGMMGTNMIGETGERNFSHFMGYDELSLGWLVASLYPFVVGYLDINNNCLNCHHKAALDKRW